ncbi:collagen alpha-1(I) chain-like [Eumetopias jubatus]|uniref:collagen alpha-1(I) chain-like n=1 Tax=Eumetopias jubatus TaxID=34886 RepID=UPI001015CD74|nr:collagen alpha-1(I) chain-like [Eumetopias jubatus]
MESGSIWCKLVFSKEHPCAIKKPSRHGQVQVRGNRGPPPPSSRPCPSQDSPRSRRLASSPARVGGKVGRQEERRDERGEGAQKGGAGPDWAAAGEACSREAPAPGAARDAKPAPDLRAPRLLPHSALRFRLWRVRRGVCGRAGARVPSSGPPPPGSAGVLAGPREPRGRHSTPGGARCSAPPARAGTMEPKLVPRRRGGGGEGSRPPPGVSRPCGPPLRNRAAAPHASRRPGSIALRGPRRHGVPDCSTRTVRPAGRPSDRRKVLGLRGFSSCGARSLPGKVRSPQCAKRSLGPVGTLPPSCRHSPGSSAR